MHHTFNPVRSTSTSSIRMKTILGRPVEAVIEKLRNPRIRSAFESIILKPSSEVDKTLCVFVLLDDYTANRWQDSECTLRSRTDISNGKAHLLKTAFHFEIICGIFLMIEPLYNLWLEP